MEQILSKTRSWPLARHIGALAFAILIGLGASWKVPLPFTPVPITGQTLFVLLGASVLTRFYSLEMIGFYLLFGVLGAPFFASHGSGVSHLFGPTGGYLLGFVLASALLGFGLSRMKGLWNQLLLFLVASYAIFIPGVIGLKFSLGVGWHEALVMGYFPFLIGDLVKIALAFTAYSGISRLSPE